MDKIKRMEEWVSVVATTNMPWELDVAAMRRFEKKILIPIPDQATRKEILQMNAGPLHLLTDEDFKKLSEQTNGYSGSDLSTMVNDALMRPIKEIQQATHFRRMEKKEFVEQSKNEEYDL